MSGPPQPAGWYPDPSGNTGVERYWDGAAWTDHYRPQKTGRGKWLAIGVAALVVIATVVIIVVATSGGSSSHNSPPPSTTTVPSTVTRPPRTTPVTRPPSTTSTPTTATPASTTALNPAARGEGHGISVAAYPFT
jgi:Protein of unknown function (DUF2510)